MEVSHGDRAGNRAAVDLGCTRFARFVNLPSGNVQAILPNLDVTIMGPSKMSQEVQGNPPPNPQSDFQQVDADAVCERCGTVNEEGTLLCKVCGQNLRDQRARRLANAAAGPEALDDRRNRTQILVGALTAIGLVVVVLVALNMGNIEAMMVSALTNETTTGEVRLWTGPDAPTYEELRANLTEAPATEFQIEQAITDPVAEDTFNGRYVLVRPDAVSVENTVGEAELLRRGTRVYFVALLSQPQMEIRGFAQLESVGGSNEFRPFVRETAGFRRDGREILGFGVANPLQGGGHQVLAFETRDGDQGRQELYAFRIR